MLLHGIYAGASSFEFRRIFDALATHFRVFAPDLPGFGLSARPARLYFTADGGLEPQPSSEATTRSYDDDPAHPVPTVGGAELTLQIDHARWRTQSRTPECAFRLPR